MILLLLPKEKFTHGIIIFMQKYFSDKDLQIIVYGDDSYFAYEKVEAKNIVSINKVTDLITNNECFNLLKKADYIILDWVSSRVVPILYPFRKKLVLLFWGADLYSVVNPESLMFKIVNIIKKRVIKDAPYIMTITPSDFTILNQACEINGKWLLGVVWTSEDSSLESDYAEIVSSDKEVSNDKIYILVGNSATKTNRHKDILDILRKYANENIEILLPLSYGDSAYAQEISEYARKIFRGKACVLNRFLDKEDYSALLKKVDVGVFYHQRQQGLGTINMLFRSGSKVYLSKENVMCSDLEAEGYLFHYTEDINIEDFNSFCNHQDSEVLHNKKISDFETNERKAVQIWNEVFFELEKSKKSKPINQ